MTRTDPVHAVARGGALNLIGSLIYGVANFAFVVVITRMLGVGHAGTLLVAIAVITVARGVTVLGANTGLVRMVSRERALGRIERIGPMVRTAVVPVALVSSVVAVALFATATPLGRLLDDGDAASRIGDLLRLFAPLLPLAAVYTVLVQGTRGFDTMRAQVVIDKIATSLALPIGAVIVIRSGGDEYAVAAWWMLVSALGFVAAWIAFARLLRAEHRAAPGRPASTDPVGREFWAFSLPRALGQSCNVAVLWFDTLLIAAWLGSTQAGIYAAGTRYLLIGTFTAEAFMQAVGPRVSGLLTQGNLASARRVVTETTVWQAGLIVPMYLVVAIFAAPLLSLFGPAYVQAEAALVFLSIGMLVAGVCGPADSVVLMSGRSRQSLRNSAIALVVNVAGNIVLVPRYGIGAAGAVWALTLVVSYGLPVLQARRTLGIETWSRALGAQVLLALITVGGVGLLARLLVGANVAGLAVTVIVGGSAYVASTWHWRDSLALRAFTPVRSASIPVASAAD